MRALIIDDNAKKDLKRVADYAAAHPFTIDDLLDVKNKQSNAAGDIAGHVCHLHDGYRIVFSLERQQGKLIKHLSVSVDKPGALPSVASVEEIMRLIGFTDEFENMLYEIEPLDKEEKHNAINVWGE